jgi:hypothetical protein
MDLTSVSHWIEMNVLAWGAMLTAASIVNIRARLQVLQALNWPTQKQVPFPEPRWNYEVGGLREFVDAVRRREPGALEFYVEKVLGVSDRWFAVMLAGFTASLWLCVALLPPPGWLEWAYPWLAWLAAPLGAMAILYGISDLAEDIKLVAILRHPGRIDPAEAAAANMLTRIKQASLGASLLGAAVFGVILVTQLLIAAKMKRDGQVPTPTLQA